MIVNIFALKITYECEPGQHAVRFHKILPHKFLKYPEDIVSGFARIFFRGGGNLVTLWLSRTAAWLIVPGGLDGNET